MHVDQNSSFDIESDRAENLALAALSQITRFELLFSGEAEAPRPHKETEAIAIADTMTFGVLSDSSRSALMRALDELRDARPVPPDWEKVSCIEASPETQSEYEAALSGLRCELSSCAAAWEETLRTCGTAGKASKMDLDLSEPDARESACDVGRRHGIDATVRSLLGGGGFEVAVLG